jgi:hypothetical protein
MGRRMSQRLFTLAALTSLAISLAVAAMWLRSCFVGDSWYGTTRHADYSVVTGRGRAMFAWHGGPRGGVHLAHESARPPSGPLTPDDTLGKLGFFLDTQRSHDGGSRLAVVFPIGAALLLMLVLPIGWAMRVAGKRRREGRCRTCGYDLRGNVSGTCPECGRPVDEGGVRPGGPFMIRSSKSI